MNSLKNIQGHTMMQVTLSRLCTDMVTIMLALCQDVDKGFWCDEPTDVYTKGLVLK